MNHVPSAVSRSLLLALEATQGDARGVLKELGKHHSRNAWEEFCFLLEAHFAAAGTAAAQRTVEEFVLRCSMVGRVAGLLADITQTTTGLLEVARAQDFVGIDVQPTHRGGLAITLTLRRGLRGSLLFFQSCVWFLAALPRVRGLGEARVLVERLSERELECLVMLPVDRAVQVDYSDATLKTLARESLMPSRASATRALLSPQVLQKRFSFTRAEARVVRRLADGHSIARIAEELEVSGETARTHVKRAMHKTNTHRQAELVSLVLSAE